MKFETYKWIYLRISSPIIIFLLVWLIFNILNIENLNYENINIFFQNFTNIIFFSLFVLLYILHTTIEVYHSIHDYFSKTKSENILRFAVICIFSFVVMVILFFFLNSIFIR